MGQQVLMEMGGASIQIENLGFGLVMRVEAGRMSLQLAIGL